MTANNNLAQNNTTPRTLPLGPVMLDVVGTQLTEQEREMLRHPLVGGVILFSRNFQSLAQLKALTEDIHSIREPALIIAVDHEGGRVQRFRDGFTRLPSMRSLGEIWRMDKEEGLRLARKTGCILAKELREQGVDLSFTPVLDLDYSRSAVIGDRAFHRDSAAVAEIAQALIAGLNEAGMKAVGKHFPGHGYVEADSHIAIPIDSRTYAEIEADDLAVYRRPANNPMSQQLAGIMPAHVIYDAVDPNPAGFSSFWLQEVLRQRLNFQGVIFSDDLSMEGATVAGDIVARADAAINAGCDMILVCNRPDLAQDLLARWQPDVGSESRERLQKFGE